MNVTERRQRIMKLIQNNRSITYKELLREFNVTKETIRKDLNALSEKGYIVRTLGGALFLEEFDPDIELRSISNHEEKRLIAREAYKLIKPKDIIAIDSGSSTLELAYLITGDIEVVVLTNSFTVLSTVAKQKSVTAIGTGGVLRPHSLSFQGETTENMMRFYNIHKAFITATALDIDKGIMDSNEGEAVIKRAMLNNVQDATLLADHSKFTSMAYITVCPVNKVNRIITSSLSDPEIVEKYRQKGIEVIVVPYLE